MLETGITLAKLEEQLLQESYARMRKVLNTSRIGVWEFEMATGFLKWSEGVESLLDLPPNSNTGNFLDYLHPEDREVIKQAISSCVAAQTHHSFEHRIIRPDGTVRWLEASAEVWQDETGSASSAIFTAVDITERKRIEQDLRTIYNGVCDAIFIHALDGTIIDVNAQVLEMYGVTRKQATQFSIQHDYSSPDSPLEQLPKLWARVLAGENVFFEWKARKPNDGSLFDVEVFLRKINLQNREVILANVRDVTLRKAAEVALRQSEARLREQVQREALLNRLTRAIRNSLDLDTILETAVNEIRNLLQIDRCLFFSNGPDLEATVAAPSQKPIWTIVREAKNPALPTLLGYHPSFFIFAEMDVLLEKISQMEIVRADDIATLDNPLLRQFFLSLGYTSLLLLPIQLRSGAIGIVSCSHSTGIRHWSDSEVELLRAVGDNLAIAINQSELYAQTLRAAAVSQAQAQQLQQTLQELHSYQAQLVQSEKMSSLGQLVAGVAHEINNPANFIHGNLYYANQYTQELLELLHLYQTQFPKTTSQIRARLEAIDLEFLKEDVPKLFSSMRMGTERIREIVLNLQAFSRLDQAEMKAVDLHEGIDSTLMILANRLKAKPGRPAIQVVREYGDLPLVECFASQLNQVFMNILTNALDALDELKVERLQVEGCNLQPANFKPSTPVICIHTSVVNSDWVAVRIADNGSGISETLQQHVFDPFFTTKPVGRGTGMGMAISYQIVTKQHGGQLRCSSTPGHGAEFVIEIPIRAINSAK